MPYSRGCRAVALAALLTLLLLVGDLLSPIPAEAQAVAPRVVATTGRIDSGLTASSGLERRVDRWSGTSTVRGAAVAASWTERRAVSRVRIRGAVQADERVRTAELRFDDGSRLLVTTNSRGDASVSFPRRSTRSVRLTVVAAARTTQSVALASFVIDDGGTAQASATVARASTSQAGRGAANVLDAASGLASGAVRGEWRTAAHDDAPTLVLSWSAPREVASVQLWGSRSGRGATRTGVLRFSDGGSLRFGAVQAGAAPPTTLAFTPRAVTSIRIELRTDDEFAALAEVAVAGRGRTPARWTPPSTVVAPSVVAAGACEVPEVPARGEGLRLVCPGPGAQVGATARVVVAAPAGADLTVSAWLPGSGAVGVVLRAQSDRDGYADLRVPTARMQRGPSALRIDATGERPLYVQVINTDGVPQPAADTSAQRRGMTLAWGEGFQGPLSISRTGAGTTYSATQPGAGGEGQFGEAVFVDPAVHGENLGVVAGNYLRIRTTPLGEDETDPWRWNRRSRGGILASAALGGGGFSAQYGYFEARILGAPGPGAWPAFWMLSTGSLVERGASTGEVDAAELYGHDTAGACRATHDWLRNGPVSDVQCGRAGVRDWALTWHTYGARITPEGTVFSIDGVEVGRSAAIPDQDQPYFFLLDLALGGGWPIDLSATGGVTDMYVDRVRVYV